MPSLTTNIDLVNAARRNKIPLVGVFFKDLLPRCVQPGGYIFNLADHDNPEGGTHWTAAWMEKGKVVYFDPFGIAPPEAVKRFFYQTDRTVDYSKKEIQNMESYICGYYCLFFLYFMSHRQRGLDIEKRMKVFEDLFSLDVEQNRKRLMAYLKPLR